MITKDIKCIKKTLAKTYVLIFILPYHCCISSDELTILILKCLFLFYPKHFYLSLLDFFNLIN